MKIKTFTILENYRVELCFEDGIKGVVDLSDLAGRGVFAQWEQPGAFKQITIGSAGELIWKCGVDLCPDALYLRATGREVSQVFKVLKAEELSA